MMPLWDKKNAGVSYPPKCVWHEFDIVPSKSFYVEHIWDKSDFMSISWTYPPHNSKRIIKKHHLQGHFLGLLLLNSDQKPPPKFLIPIVPRSRCWNTWWRPVPSSLHVPKWSASPQLTSFVDLGSKNLVLGTFCWFILLVQDIFTFSPWGRYKWSKMGSSRVKNLSDWKLLMKPTT